MAVLILESVERALVSRLLQVSEIFDIYRSSSDRWTEAIVALNTVPPRIKTRDGTPVKVTPREVLTVFMPFMEIGNDSLFLAIGRLQESSIETLKDLYRRLEALEVRRVSGPEARGLFLILAKLSEDSRIFENAIEN